MLIVAVPISLVFSTSAVQAHDWGIYPDSNLHEWCLGSSTNGYPGLLTAIDQAMENLDTQTDMSVPDFPLACDSETDVQWAQGNADGNRGIWRCVDNSPTSAVCTKARLTVNVQAIDNDGGPPQLNLRKTACHELGHSVGQGHHERPYDDCMVIMSVTEGHTQYNADHRTFINNRW